MRRITVSLSIFIVALFVFSSSGAASWWSSPSDDVMKRVGDQRLSELLNPVPLVTTNGLYHTYDEMTVLLQSLAQNHSDILSLSSIGTTYEGRQLWMVKLSDNVDQEEDEPGVLLMGAHHGNEKPGYEVLIYFLLFMIENYENNTNGVREVVNNTQIFVLPMVNPDGVEAGTRKNREPNHGPFGFQKNETSIGVDLNRNYGYRSFLLFFFPRIYQRATSYHDGSEVYRGEHPFSENETTAIKGFIDTHTITICLTYHTSGELVLYPWGYTTLPVKDQPVFVSIGENITHINNYTLSPSIELYPTLGDACDWLYARHDVLAFTIELGKTQAPNDPEILEEICTTHANVNLYVCQRAETL